MTEQEYMDVCVKSRLRVALNVLHDAGAFLMPAREEIKDKIAVAYNAIESAVNKLDEIIDESKQNSVGSKFLDDPKKVVSPSSLTTKKYFQNNTVEKTE